MALERPSRKTLVARGLTLLPRDEGQPGGTFPASKTVLIGTHSICEIFLTNPSLSQRHALLACQPGGRWWVYDLHSRRGVRVNGKPVKGKALQDGDTLQLGDLGWDVQLAGESKTKGSRISKNPMREFRLLQLLHHGKNGKIYRAVWQKREVALRVFAPEFGSDKLFSRRLKERLPQTARLHHDNIVRLYRGGRYTDRKQRKRWLLASEYMAGGSLRDRLAERTQPLGVAEAMKFALDIASALWVAASMGFRHRNVNPSCILFDGDGRAKLGDFLHARPEAEESTDLTRNDQPTVELVYRAPEQIKGQTDLPESADLYSLAACLYEALTLRPPFAVADRGVLELVQAIREEKPISPRELNPDVPPKLADLILDTLAKNPALRPATCDEFLQRLAKAVDRT